MDKCTECKHETKAVATRQCEGKMEQRIVCKNYDCPEFSEAHLYFGEKMPERKTDKPKTKTEPKPKAKKSPAKKSAAKKGVS